MKGRLLVAVQFACLIALVLIPSASAPTATRFLVARLIVAIAGTILAIAFINLRESVTVYPEPRAGVPFITQGIYKYVRHPMYIGVLLFGASMVVTKWTLASLAIWLVLFADLQIKYHYEDRLLAARWPDAALYQASVGALLPKFIAPRP